MTTLLIIAVMITVLLGATSYALMNASTMLSSQVDRATTETRLEEAARGILANIVVIPSASAPAYAVPAPDTASASNIPGWIMANAVNAKGVPFLYCPYTNINSGTKATAITVPSGSYNVNVATLYTGSKNFVTISDARPANAASALAIIVAPGEKASAAGDCTTITASGTIAGNNVRVITEADVMARDSVNASTGNQLYVGTAASGDGSGRSANNLATLDTAMTYTNQYRPQYMRLDLAAGSYGTTSSVFTQPPGTNRARTTARNSSIDIRGANISTTTIYTDSSFDSRFVSNIYLQDLAIGPGASNAYIRFLLERNGAFITNNVSLQFLNMYSMSNWYVMGPFNLISTSASGEYIRLLSYSKLYVDAAFNFPTGSDFYLGVLRNYGSDIVFGANSAITMNTTVSGCATYVYGLSRAYLLGTYINTQTSGSPYLSCTFSPTQFYFSNATVTGLRTYMFDTPGRVVIDRGTSFVSTASNTPPAYFRNSQGTEIFITNSTMGSAGTASLRPSSTAVFLQTTGTQYGVGSWIIGGGTNGGWPVSNLSVQTTGSYSCWDGNSDNFNVAANTNIGNGAYSRSVGAVGFEPWLINNQSNWYCNR